MKIVAAEVHTTFNLRLAHELIMEGAWFESTVATNDTINSNTSEVRGELLYSYGERVFTAICLLLFTITGTTGNSMVIIAVIFSRKLQTATNVFVVSLATADLLTNLFVFWNVVSLLSQDGWPLPNAHWLCVISGFMLFICTCTSMYSLAAIALNRLILITKPLPRYQHIFKPLHLGIMVALTWIIPFSLCLALPLAGIGGFGYDKQQATCSDLDLHPKADTFHLAQAITFYPIPLITIIACYILIFRHVRQHLKKQRGQNEKLNTIKPTAFSSGVSSGPASVDMEAVIANKSDRKKKLMKMEIDITKNLFLVVCMFLLFMSPYFIALFIPGSDYFLLYGGIIVLANSTINPVIYARRHPQFKVVLGCMLKRRYADIPEPSLLLRKMLNKQ